MHLVNWDEIKYFKKEEFNCTHTGNNLMEHNFMMKLDMLRKSINRPLVISSGFRDETHPVEVRKTKPGMHTKGIACDILANHKHALDIIKIALDIGFMGIGVNQKGNYDGRFIHVDLRESESPILWSY